MISLITVLKRFRPLIWLLLVCSVSYVYCGKKKLKLDYLPYSKCEWVTKPNFVDKVRCKVLHISVYVVVFYKLTYYMRLSVCKNDWKPLHINLPLKTKTISAVIFSWKYCIFFIDVYIIQALFAFCVWWLRK